MIFNPVIPNSGGGSTSEWINQTVSGVASGKVTNYDITFSNPNHPFSVIALYRTSDTSAITAVLFPDGSSVTGYEGPMSISITSANGETTISLAIMLGPDTEEIEYLIV